MIKDVVINTTTRRRRCTLDHDGRLNISSTSSSTKNNIRKITTTGCCMKRIRQQQPYQQLKIQQQFNLFVSSNFHSIHSFVCFFAVVIIVGGSCSCYCTAFQWVTTVTTKTTPQTVPIQRRNGKNVFQTMTIVTKQQQEQNSFCFFQKNHHHHNHDAVTCLRCWHETNNNNNNNNNNFRSHNNNNNKRQPTRIVLHMRSKSRSSLDYNDNNEDDSSSSSRRSTNMNHNNNNSPTDYNLLQSSMMDSEGKPIRRQQFNQNQNQNQQQDDNDNNKNPLSNWKQNIHPRNDWGIERREQSRPLLSSSSSSSSSSSTSSVGSSSSFPPGPFQRKKALLSSLSSRKGKYNNNNNRDMDKKQKINDMIVQHPNNKNNNNNKKDDDDNDTDDDDGPVSPYLTENFLDASFYQYPCTLIDVAKEVVVTIQSILYNRLSSDPNQVQNVYVGHNDLFRTRPIRTYPKDSGRIGIEIDGTSTLLSYHNNNNNNSKKNSYSKDGSYIRSSIRNARISSYTAQESTNTIVLRTIAILIGQMLSKKPWIGYEKEESYDENHDHSNSVNHEYDSNDDNEERETEKIDPYTNTTQSSFLRPKKSKKEKEETNKKSRTVVLYFNTIQHALAASRELHRLRAQEEQEEHHYEDGRTSRVISSYDSIQILTLGDPIPTELHLPKQQYKTKNKNKLPDDDSNNNSNNGKVDPTRGLILIVQPTDYNLGLPITTSSTSTSSAGGGGGGGGSAVNTIHHFQLLIATAAICQIPVVTISPRFYQHPLYEATTSSSSSTTSFLPFLSSTTSSSQQQEQQTQISNNNFPRGNGWEQSGYQQAALYGGLEPPNGPTPWLLRDFSPPVYCWIGNALDVSHLNHNNKKINRGDNNNNDIIKQDVVVVYTHVSLVQSTAYPGHTWHIYASKNCYSYSTTVSTTMDDTKLSRNDKYTNDDDEPYVQCRTSYEYLCSTKSAAGRPTREVLYRLFCEYASYQK